MDSARINNIARKGLELGKELDTLRSNAFGNGKFGDEGVYVHLHNQFEEFKDSLKNISSFDDNQLNSLENELNQFGRSLRRVGTQMHINNRSMNEFSLVKILKEMLLKYK